MSCPDCGGAGKIELFSSWEDPCHTCKGSGTILGKDGAKYYLPHLRRVKVYLSRYDHDLGKWIRVEEESEDEII